jgi:hypothetical protein
MHLPCQDEFAAVSLLLQFLGSVEVYCAATTRTLFTKLRPSLGTQLPRAFSFGVDSLLIYGAPSQRIEFHREINVPPPRSSRGVQTARRPREVKGCTTGSL